MKQRFNINKRLYKCVRIAPTMKYASQLLGHVLDLYASLLSECSCSALANTRNTSEIGQERSSKYKISMLDILWVQCDVIA